MPGCSGTQSSTRLCALLDVTGRRGVAPPRPGPARSTRTPPARSPDVAALLWTGWVTYPTLPGTYPGYAYQVQSGDIFFSTPESDTLGDADIGSAGSALGQDKVAVWQDGTACSASPSMLNCRGHRHRHLRVRQSGRRPARGHRSDPAAAGRDGGIQPDGRCHPGHAVCGAGRCDAERAGQGPGGGLVAGPGAAGRRHPAGTGRLAGAAVGHRRQRRCRGRRAAERVRRPAAGAWQASGSTLLAPGDPATFTADARGRVTFATPAVELDAPQLTVSIVSAADSLRDAASLRSAPTWTCRRSWPVTAPLNDLGTLTRQARCWRGKADGTKLCPVLASMPADQQAQAACAVARRSASASRPGRASRRARTTSKSWILDMKPGVPAYTSSTEPAARKARVTGWGRCRAGGTPSRTTPSPSSTACGTTPVQVATCTANWVQDETGERLELGGQRGRHPGRRRQAERHYVITDIKSAIHAVTAFFRQARCRHRRRDQLAPAEHRRADQGGQRERRRVEGWLDQAPGS